MEEISGAKWQKPGDLQCYKELLCSPMANENEDVTENYSDN